MELVRYQCQSYLGQGYWDHSVIRVSQEYWGQSFWGVSQVYWVSQLSGSGLLGSVSKVSQVYWGQSGLLGLKLLAKNP